MGMNPRGRSRGRNHNNFNNNNRRFNNGPNRNTVYDSIGPAGRLRGTAFQLMEKYQSAAKELMSSDRVVAESCLQHADHYMRINAMAIAAEGARFAQQNQPEAVAVVAEAEEQPVVVQVEPEEVVQPAETEPEMPAFVTADLSVPVLAMAENETRVRRGRPPMKKEPVADGENTPVIQIKRRGRPAKKAVSAEA